MYGLSTRGQQALAAKTFYFQALQHLHRVNRGLIVLPFTRWRCRGVDWRPLFCEGSDRPCRLDLANKDGSMSDINGQLTRERRYLVLLGIICLSLIGGALYMQVVLGEAPCPLCILQRYALLLIAIFAFLAAAMPGRKSITVFEGLVVVSALGGMAAAGNHAWVLAHPSDSCGIDVLQPIVDGLPMASWFPMVFQVSGFCTTPYPPVLGLSLAQWALLAFVLTAVLVPLCVYRNRHVR
jgi:disulfide bond formation protein DsbB